MIKILIGGAVLLACLYLGIGLDRYYRVRKELLAEYVAFLRYTEKEIRYFKRGLGEIINDFSARKKSTFEALIRDYPARLLAGEKWTASSPYLNEQDRTEIEQALNSFRGMNYLNAEQVLSNALEEGERMEERAKKAKKEKGELYRKLAILIGVALLILLL